MKLLFDRIDEPGLNTLPVYERRGGYQALRKALAMTPEDVEEALDDVREGRPVLPAKQLATRLVADPRANTQEFPPHKAVG